MKNTCISVFLSENFQFLEVIFSIYLNRRVIVMQTPQNTASDQGLHRLQIVFPFFSRNIKV